jgi:hypothetical protein
MMLSDSWPILKGNYEVCDTHNDRRPLYSIFQYFRGNMVATVSLYTDERNRALVGDGFDGVVRISAGGYTGTGVLLFDGCAVLTAAHLLQRAENAPALSATVFFETVSGNVALTSEKIQVMPDYDVVDNNHDLALIWLPHPAPVTAERYEIYRASDELGSVMTLVGYGLPGTGSSGMLDFPGAYYRLKALNSADADAGTLKEALGSLLGWTPEPDTQLVADFDDGQEEHDALGQLLAVADLGYGIDEGLITSGDSGGPAFITGKIAGIASYTAGLYSENATPDIDAITNSSFGEVSVWQRVSHYQQWIDQSVRAQYQDAPRDPSEVRFAVPEGDDGVSHVYFLLRFFGVRPDPDAWISVDYATRNGTATAGEDYLSTEGTLVLYPDETFAVIPVEIIGDDVLEPDETLYLDATNPVGGSFGPEVLVLTAVRTILDDDGWLGL